MSETSGTNFTSATPDQSESKSPVRTPDSSSGEQRYMDYVLNSIKYLNDIVSEKHDLSKPKDGYIIHKRLVTADQAASRSNLGFIQSLTKNKQNKVWEYFVFVPEISDPLITPTVEQVDIYTQMIKSASDSKVTSKEAKKPDSINKIFEDEFPGTQYSDFIEKIENYLLSCHRFYGVSSSGPGNGVRKCKVLFHNPKKLQFGKMTKVEDAIPYEFSLGLKARIRDAKRDLGIKPSSAEKNKKREQKKNIENSLERK